LIVLPAETNTLLFPAARTAIRNEKKVPEKALPSFSSV